jgi:hypothetical protein
MATGSRFHRVLVLSLIPATLAACATVPADRGVASQHTRSAGDSPIESRASGPHRLLPDRALTPGAVMPGCTKEKVCTPGYADGNDDMEGARNVDEATRSAAFARYGIPNANPADYEVDHLISLELCGSNELENLWPESYDPVPGAHEKDRVEDELHEQVCKGDITLEQAQEIIRTNWYPSYLKMKSQ